MNEPSSSALSRSGRPPDGLSARQLGLNVFLVSLSVLFAASLVGYFVTRAQSPHWRIADRPGLPGGLWLSTLILVGVSFALEGALRAVRRNQLKALSMRLWFGLGFVVSFLVAQVENWTVMRAAELALPAQSLFTYTFYLLTGLHAAHVLGGLIPLGIVMVRAERREYSSSHHEGVGLCVKYWHFLGVVWLVLFGALHWPEPLTAPRAPTSAVQVP
jgi:cytochrome c oxidase subunit III